MSKLSFRGAATLRNGRETNKIHEMGQIFKIRRNYLQLSFIAYYIISYLQSLIDGLD